MALVSAQGSPVILSEAGQWTVRLNITALRVVNGSNAGEVYVTKGQAAAGAGFFRRYALAANGADQVEFAKPECTELYVTTIPTGAFIYVYHE